MTDVFISYASETVVEAKRVAQALGGLGYAVWRDEDLPPHRPYADVIEERLRTSRAVLVLWSRSALQSQWVRAEADFARNCDKLVQVTIDGAMPPLPFNQTQCADLSKWRGNLVDPRWRKVVDSVSDLVGTTPNPAAKPSQAVRDALGPAPRRKLSRASRPIMWAGTAIVGLALVAAVWATVAWLNRLPALATPVVEVRPMSVIGDDPALRPLAARAADALAAFLGESEVRVIAGSSHAAPAKAQLAFGGAVSSADGQIRLHLLLDDNRSDTTIWSADYSAPAPRADALIDQAEGGAITAINLLRYDYGPNGLTLDPEIQQVALQSGEEALMPTLVSRIDAVHHVEQALARQPDSGLVQASYAADLASAGLLAAPSEQADLFKRARAQAEQAIREHRPQAGPAYLALLVIGQAEAPTDWVAGQARLDATLKAAPDDAFVHGYACDFMRSVGRANDAVYYCQHALALLPHTASLVLGYAVALEMQGDRADADKLFDEDARLFPDFVDARIMRFDMDAWSGSPDRARALMHDPATSPPFPPPYAAAAELLEKARKSGQASDADAAMNAMRSATAHETLMPWRVLFPMALNRLDDAFGAPDLAIFETRGAGALMLPFSDRLRRDTRFWPLAARAGLVRYWVTTNQWPDFCSDPTYPLNCRRQAQRVLAGRGR